MRNNSPDCQIWVVKLMLFFSCIGFRRTEFLFKSHLPAASRQNWKLQTGLWKVTSGWLDGETAARVGARGKRPVGDVNTERFDCSLTDVGWDPAETGWVLLFPFWLCADWRFQVKKKSLVEHLSARIYQRNSFVSFVLREFKCLNISMTRFVTVHNITATDNRD